LNPRSWLGSNETAAQPEVVAHWPRQSWKVGAKFWLMSLPSMMNPHMVVKLVPSACCVPPSVAQFELAPGNSPIAESLLLENRVLSGRSPDIRIHRDPSKEAPSHFGWNEEHRSTHAVKSKASSMSRTSPFRFLLHRTVNSWDVPMVVPFPFGHGALLFCRRCTLARPTTCNSRDDIVRPNLLVSMWTALG
jgi:hypothetical protein